MDAISRYRKFIGDNEFIEELIGPGDATDKGKTGRRSKRADVESEPADVFVFQKSPSYVNCLMRDYQVEGLNWLINMHENGINCILADEMGLGKTLQTISLLGYLKYTKKEEHCHLVIVPKSTLQNWVNEFKRFLPDFKVRIFHCPKVEMKKRGAFVARKRYDVCITTYEMVLNGKKILKRAKFSYVIIDEAHRIKNENSILSVIVRLLDCEHRLLLTGTPLQNNIKELWALLNFIIPDIFSDAEKFENYVNNAEDEHSVDKLRNVLQLFFLRREKIDVEKSLLPKKTLNLYANLSEMQRTWYKMILTKDLSPILGLNSPRSALMNVVVQLRKCCNHPYLFPEAEPGPPYTTDVHIIDNCGKMILLDKLLDKYKKIGSRVLIFCQMARMVDILEDYCIFREFEYCRLDGMTQSEDRTTAIEEFNCPNSTKFVFLLTTRAGGLGINLATADIVILYDTDWNPQMDLQAQDRAHRIGQKKQVMVYRLLTSNTIEEKILERSLQKLKLDEIFLQKKDRKMNFNQNELIEILAQGVDKLDETIEPDELEEILRLGEKRTQEMEKALSETTLATTTNCQINAYEFEGENYNLKKLRENLPSVELEGKRRKMFISERKPNIIEYPAYQFYPTELREIQKKEIDLFQMGQSLSPEDQARKAKMLSLGFDTWTRKEFNNFIKALTIYGKSNMAKVAEYIDKDEEEVKKYFSVFWERHGEIPDSEKIIAQIAKAETNVEKNNFLKNIFLNNMKNYKTEFPYLVNTRSKFYPDAFDFFLLESYVKHCDNIDPFYSVFIDVRRSKKFKYNFFIKTRGASDLQRRINTLINGIFKNNEIQ